MLLFVERIFGRSRPWPTTGIVVLVSLLATAGLTLAVRAAHDDNESRLTRQRTREAAAVFTAVVPSLEVPLATTAAFANAVDEPDLRRSLEAQTKPDGRFASVSVWPDGAVRPSIVAGEAPELAEEPSAEIEEVLANARDKASLTVVNLLDAPEPRVGYAVASSAQPTGFVVYAEQAFAADRTAAVRSDSAFVGLDYAIYLGKGENGRDLLASSRPELPLRGRRAVEHIPFGDTTLTLVMSPYDDLGGSLLANLPWIVLGSGLLLSLAAAALTEGLLRRRHHAELLAVENARLYAEQRAAAHTLQQNLLPRRLPDLPGVDIAVRYVPGVIGTEVGGDWYDVIEVEGRLVVVVGDVSGRGLDAAGVMASVRYAMRALAAQRFAPQDILARVELVDAADRDGHFATVLCGMIDLATGEATFANAGHPPPLLLTEGDAHFVEIPVGPPVGVLGRASYEPIEVSIPAGSTLLMVTDGLFERRGESIDVGLERLRASASAVSGDFDSRVDQILEELTGGEARDDAAILAVRWRA